jgi:HTH-type transcriptional regulator/antitoxin HigA
MTTRFGCRNHVTQFGGRAQEPNLADHLRPDPIKPIKTEEDYKAALAEVATLMDAELDTPEGDRLDVLSTLIEAYEARHWPIDPPDPIDAIKARMAQHGLRPRDLEPLLGGRGRVSEVLNRKRPLTLAMIRRLHRELGIPAAVLVKEPPIAMPSRSRKKHSPSRPRRNRKLS